MKKLMMIAAAMTIASGAFATVNVYDYKASMKTFDLKFMNVKVNNVKVQVVTKYQKKHSIYGYVMSWVNDDDVNYDPLDGILQQRGYVVLANKKNKIPTILPSSLMVQAWPSNAKLTRWTAQGYLVAGEAVTDDPWSTTIGATFDGSQELWSEANSLVPVVSSAYLFGQYNYPRPDTGAFADAWLIHAGTGKVRLLNGNAGDCCQMPGGPALQLDKMTGCVVGGMFLCGQAEGQLWLVNSWGVTTEKICGSWSLKCAKKFLSVPLALTGDLLTTNVDEMDAAINGAILRINLDYSFDNVFSGIDNEGTYLY